MVREGRKLNKKRKRKVNEENGAMPKPTTTVTPSDDQVNVFDYNGISSCMWKCLNFHGSAVSTIVSIESERWLNEKHVVCIMQSDMNAFTFWTRINMLWSMLGWYILLWILDRLMVERMIVLCMCLDWVGWGSWCQCHAIGIDMAPRFLQILRLMLVCIRLFGLQFFILFLLRITSFVQRFWFESFSNRRTKRFSSGKW